MLNYTKTRESIQKSSAKKSLGKGSTANKSHISSINIKFSQDISSLQNVKIPLKTMFKQRCESYMYTLNKKPQNNLLQPQKKNSLKLPSNQKQNIGRKKQFKQNYEVGLIRPFQETNRYLETQRLNKQNKKSGERSTSKTRGLKIKNDHLDGKMRTQYIDTSVQKYKKDHSSKHNASNFSKIKIPTVQLKNLFLSIVQEQKQIFSLKRQLEFFRKYAEREGNNSVFQALKH